jgi:hypothetical protein
MDDAWTIFKKIIYLVIMHIFIKIKQKAGISEQQDGLG